ncbi:hypothetical protein NLJ89_g11493 [Agrocybe chaxingu]|uniref:Uncharacterized protein n=1 Tax=Agrocybe chaxingu TaxID=84603 RepID=A0A9W8JNM1_9AGAR|nr:hypothetical protein NLJ89_g11493 [Agrocybe chaxingu]
MGGSRGLSLSRDFLQDTMDMDTRDPNPNKDIPRFLVGRCRERPDLQDLYHLYMVKISLLNGLQLNGALVHIPVRLHLVDPRNQVIHLTRLLRILIPSASLHTTGSAALRPPSRPSTAASNPSTPGGSSAYPPSAISEHPPSPYSSVYPPPSGRPPQAGGSSYTPSVPASTIPQPGGPPSPSFGHGSTAYPQPGGSSYTPSVSPGLSFPAGPPPASSYAPPVPASGYPGQTGSGYPGQTGSSYPGQTGSSYPGQQGGPSLYNAPPVPPGGSSYAPWSGGPSHVSPPQSPPGHALSFPGQSTYPQPPPARPYGTSDVSNPPLLGGIPGGSGNSSPAPQFPQASGGDASYFAAGGSGTMGTMPGGSSSYGSSYPGQHGPSTSRLLFLVLGLQHKDKHRRRHRAPPLGLASRWHRRLPMGML